MSCSVADEKKALLVASRRVHSLDIWSSSFPLIFCGSYPSIGCPGFRTGLCFSLEDSCSSMVFGSPGQDHPAGQWRWQTSLQTAGPQGAGPPCIGIFISFLLTVSFLCHLCTHITRLFSGRFLTGVRTFCKNVWIRHPRFSIQEFGLMVWDAHWPQDTCLWGRMKNEGCDGLHPDHQPALVALSLSLSAA